MIYNNVKQLCMKKISSTHSSIWVFDIIFLASFPSWELMLLCLMFPLNILCQQSFCSNFWQTDFHPLKYRHVFILICWCFGIILKNNLAQYFKENSIFYTFSNRNFPEYQKVSSHLHEDKILNTSNIFDSFMGILFKLLHWTL